MRYFDVDELLFQLEDWKGSIIGEDILNEIIDNSDQKVLFIKQEIEEVED